MNRRLRTFFELFVISVSMAGRLAAQQLGNVFTPPDVPVAPDEQTKPMSDDNATPDVFARPELPNDQIVRETGGQPYPNLFYAAGSPGRLEPNVGGARLDLPENIFRPSLSFKLPFLKAAGPATNAEIQVGRLYYDVTSLSGSLLYTDNKDLSEVNRQGGIISIAELKGVLYIQILENMRLAARVGVVWFPFQNKAGVDGFTQDSVNGRVLLGDSERFHAQLSYDLHPGNWDLLFYDEVRVQQVLFAENYQLAAAEPFDEADRTGRYVFRSDNIGNNVGNSPVRVNETGTHNGEAFIYDINQVGATASRLLPTETRAAIGGYRLDYMYLGGGSTLLPRSREVGFVSFNSERDSLRFKPFLDYQIYRYDSQKWDQEMHAGLRGPVTENIQISGGVGYFIGGNTGRDRFLADVILRHTIGPFTSQVLEYRRDITAPVQNLEESYSYDLWQRLGQHFSVNPFVTYSTFEDLSSTGTGTRELRAGLLFTSDTSAQTRHDFDRVQFSGESGSGNTAAKTTFSFGPVFERVQYTSSPLAWSRWSALAEISHFLTESFQARLIYQYQNRRSNQVGDSYYDNVIMLTLTKYFDAPQQKVDATSE